MPPLPCHTVGARQDVSANDDAPTSPGADDHAKHHARARGGTVGGFGQRKTIGIIRQPDRTAERGR
jgi:hypothetical protein